MPSSVLIPFGRRTSYVNTGLGDFDRVFHNLFHNALGNLSAPAGNIGDLSVRLNVAETQASYMISAELPGIDEKDIELTVHDGVLTLKGERQSEAEEEGKTWHRVERTYGRFSRALQLPGDADENKVTASMRNGVLQIEIAKAKEDTKTTKRIDIRHG